MPLTPTWTAAPSGTRAATCRPTARSTSPTVGGGYSTSGSSTSTHASTWLRCSQQVPRGRAQRRVLRPRVGKIPEVDAAEQREVAQPLGLRADLREQRDGLAAGGRHEDLHAGAEPLDGGAR